MKHSIIHEYILWLEKQEKNEENKKLKGLILRLKGDLISIARNNTKTSCPYKKTLRCLSAYFLMKKKSDNAYLALSYDVFFEQINSWIKELQSLNSALLVVQQLLPSFDNEPQNIQLLLLFIKEILNEPWVLFHTQTPDLLDHLQAKNFPNVLSYLQSLSCTKPYPGIFIAIKPLNESHNICLDLLRNLRAKSRDTLLWNRANDLLTIILDIYSFLQPLGESSLSPRPLWALL